MKHQSDLTTGSITKKILLLALPLMGTSFIQMAYNLMDMMWIGKLGSSYVSVVGTAGFFPWLGFSLIMLARIGTEVKVSQSIGAKNAEDAKAYAGSGLQLIGVLSVAFMLLMIVFGKPLIGFFNLTDTLVVENAEKYLFIVALGMPFAFANPVMTGIFNGLGNGKTPFKINAISLAINAILDPVLIFGLGMGVAGAALATIFAQLVGFVLFILAIRSDYQMKDLLKVHILRPIHMYMDIIKISWPASVQSALFTIISIFIARLIATWGPIPIAVQKVGSQIESLTWMTASGVQGALGAFTGQNYGAKKLDRIRKGYGLSLGMMAIYALFTTALLMLGGEFLFKLFINEADVIPFGAEYLWILGASQVFMCVEIVTAGVFNGLGKTIYPSVVSIVFTGARIPLAILLMNTSLGLNGIWWAISISSVFKGVVLVSLYMLKVDKRLRNNVEI